jgi:DNA-3-methyladenine glycosylase
MGALPLEFFDRPTLKVARELIGCRLAIERNGKVTRFVVTETEAYDGSHDLASHAARGKTKRNEIMFRHAGHIYVYFCYGIHWMLNVVTGDADYPAAVLIRGVETLDGEIHHDGPAKLTKALGITGKFNGQVLSRSAGLWFESPKKKLKVVTTPRIGIDYAGPIWSQKHYRFIRG